MSPKFCTPYLEITHLLNPLISKLVENSVILSDTDSKPLYYTMMRKWYSKMSTFYPMTSSDVDVWSHYDTT